MRYIFFLLLALNGSLLAWGIWAEKGVPVMSDAPQVSHWVPEGVAEIRLLDAGVGPRKPGPDKQTVTPEAGSPRTPGFTPACFRLGPLFGGRRAQDLAARIRATGAAVLLNARDGQLQHDYWVMIPPQSTRQEAQLRFSEFRARNIDSFVITQGPMANAISLGLFTQPNLAEELGQRLSRMGYADVEVRAIPRDNQEIWLRIASRLPADGASPEWQSLLTSPIEQNWKQESCGEALLSAVHELEFAAPRRE